MLDAEDVWASWRAWRAAWDERAKALDRATSPDAPPGAVEDLVASAARLRAAWDTYVKAVHAQ